MNLVIENKIKFEHLMVLGDTHGNNMQIAPQLLTKYGLDNAENPKAILHLGDFGIGFSTYKGDLEKLRNLNNRLKNYNTFLYVIRGNHDNPEWFNDTEHIETMLGNEMIENVILLPDHTLLSLEVEGREEPVKIYCNGGAYSIDRIKRTPGKSYWSDEAFKCLSAEKLAEIPNDLDIIITHTRPHGVWPVDKSNIQYWLLEDLSLYRDIEEEAAWMKQMFDSIKEDNDSFLHFYGHFHNSNKESYEFDGKRYIHQCLDIDELVEVRVDQLK
tara:strand:- start:29 stop:841 length:813 start_codon:yes stop_codon:yes gene_type:complete